ncbi:MAG TPA: DMT family transporter [Rhizomicrobium sp.]|jgi:drug/metabolite transporter (DMT)-like permease|nr:DMT family transporter [Rhizomicrobium sp.]
MRHSSLGIALKLGATFAFSLMYTVIKLAGDVPIGQVVFFRAFFALVPLFAFAAFTVGPRAVMRTNHPVLHIARSGAGVASMFLNFTALSLLPLADLTAFSFVMPIFAVVLSVILLHEKVGRYRWGAVLVGFTGILLMIEPHGGIAAVIGHGASPGAAMALGAAFLSAFVVIFIRQMSATERSETIVFYFMATCTIVGAISMIWDRVSLTPMMAMWLVLCGLLGGIGQLCMTFSYRYAAPSLLAPFDYAAMVWAVLLGYFVFTEVPEIMVMAGSAVVIAAGLFIVWRERQLHRPSASTARPIQPL